MPDAPTVVSCSKLSRRIVSRIMCKPLLTYFMQGRINRVYILLLVLLMAVHDY